MSQGDSVAEASFQKVINAVPPQLSEVLDVYVFLNTNLGSISTHWQTSTTVQVYNTASHMLYPSALIIHAEVVKVQPLFIRQGYMTCIHGVADVIDGARKKQFLKTY